MRALATTLAALITGAGLSFTPRSFPVSESPPGQTVAALETRVATLETQVALLQSAPSRSPTPSNVGVGTPVTSAGVLVTLAISDPRAGPQTLRFRTRYDDGRPLRGAATTVLVQMPAMSHGVSGYLAAEVAPGRYEARDVSLGMPGNWQIDVIVVRPGRTPATARFIVTLTEQSSS
jgi:hypothetical protein